MEPLTILCITGWCRNGSTIIGNVLNEVPGVFHVGELHFLWKNSVGRGANSSCGCGLNLAKCSKQHIRERAIHCLRHDHGQNESGRAIQGARNNQKFAVEHKTHRRRR